MTTDLDLAGQMYRNFCEMWRAVGAFAANSAVFAVRQRPDMLLIRSQFSSRVPHMVLDPRVAPGREREWTQALVQEWTSEPVSVMVQLPPGTERGTLAACLREQGFLQGMRPTVAMARRAAPSFEPRDDPDVELASEPLTLDIARRVLGEVFGLPSAVFAFYTPPSLVQTFILREHGAAVGAACLCPFAGAAGIYSVGVLPAARGRGYARRLVQSLLGRASEIGLTAAVLSCDRQVAPLYRRLGFSICAELQSYWLEAPWH